MQTGILKLIVGAIQITLNTYKYWCVKPKS